ncbi:hypothetical protein Ctob_012676 [Chrysochromulina tobinii]|uniref:EF-hand domain-containing protein n=1 Tax=Chrysochromulina tobinii TaxID=1460289 RepID=A0A0M0K6Q3_9EUKA|nr:hypothetical protein Ctob_012676 [Chrysochromulina tobinii]|eukprot:KOO34480.1 hypothetical protein Ctob_012676 [Chrysochromulina sp. CCMP291]
MTPRTFSAAASGARFLSDGTFSCSLGTLSLDEVSAARVNFEKFDVDGDGIISRADFGAAMCRHDLSFRDSSRREQLDTMYAAVDLDGTGQVTLEKFAVMRVRKKMHSTQRSQAQPRTLPAPNRTLPAPSRLPPPGPPAIGYASPRAAMPRPPSAMPQDMDEMSPTQQRQLDAMRKEMMQDRLEHAVMDYQQQAAMAAAAQAAAMASMSPRGGGGSFQVHLPPGATARGMGAPVPPLMLPAAGGGFTNAGCGLTARGEAATGSGAGRLGGFATQRTTNYLMALSQAYYAANPHGNGWLPSRHMYDLLCQVAQQYALPLSAAQAAELCQNADAGDGYCNLHQVLGSDSFSHFFQQLAPGPEIAMRPGGALPSTASTAPTASRERSCEAGGYSAPILSPRSQLPPTPPGYGVSQYTPRVDGAVAYGASQYTPRVPGAMVGYGGAAAYGDDADRLAALAAEAADATKREAKARVRAMQDEANEAASESVAVGADARRALQRGDLALAGQLAARAESRAAEARAKRRMAESLHASLGFTGQIGETPRGEAAPVDEEKLRASRQSAAAAAAAALTSRRSSEGGVTSRFGAALGMDADAAKERYEQLTPRTGAKAAQIASISSLMGAAADAEEDWTPAPTPREVTALRDGNGNCATKSPVAAAARGAGDGGATARGDGGATARGDGGATARGDGGATARDGVTGDRSAGGSAGPIASPYVPQVPLHLVASAPKGGATVLSSRGVLHPSAHLSATEGAPKRSTGLLGRLGRRATKDKSGARVVRASSEERRSRASSDEEVEEGPEVDGPPPTDDLQRL